MASLDLVELQSLADEGGYTGMAALSSFSAVMLLSACRAFMHDRSFWTGADFDLTDDEADEIDELVSQTEYELMLSTVGLIMPHAGADIPPWALLCDGTQYARADYPDLYAALDSAFIDDADNFTVPDLRERFVQGVAPATAIGDTGGVTEHTLSVGQLASHSHTNLPHTHSYVVGVPAPILVGAGAPVPNVATQVPGVTGASGVTIDSTGSGDPIDHMNPFLVLSYIIVAGY